MGKDRVAYGKVGQDRVRLDRYGARYATLCRMTLHLMNNYI